MSPVREQVVLAGRSLTVYWTANRTWAKVHGGRGYDMGRQKRSTARRVCEWYGWAFVDGNEPKEKPGHGDRA